MALKLMQTHQITFTRHGDDTDKTYVDEYGNTIAPTTTSEIVTCGSLQPFSKKQNRVGLPEGFREEDYWVYYSTSNLRTIEQFDNLTCDSCVNPLDGKTYKVLRKGRWNEFCVDGKSLLANNNEYYLQLVQPKGS